MQGYLMNKSYWSKHQFHNELKECRKIGEELNRQSQTIVNALNVVAFVLHRLN